MTVSATPTLVLVLKKQLGAEGEDEIEGKLGCSVKLEIFFVPANLMAWRG